MVRVQNEHCVTSGEVTDNVEISNAAGNKAEFNVKRMRVRQHRY